MKEIMSERNQHFQAVVKHPVARQAYIDELNWKTILPFVSRINYKRNTIGEKHTISAVEYSLSDIFNNIVAKNSDKKISIDIYAKAFESKFIENSYDFIHHLFNYAGYMSFESVKNDLNLLYPIPKFSLYDDTEFRKKLDENRTLKYAKSTLNSDVNSEKYTLFIDTALHNNEKRLGTLSRNYVDSDKELEEMLKNNSPKLKEPLYTLRY